MKMPVHPRRELGAQRSQHPPRGSCSQIGRVSHRAGHFSDRNRQTRPRGPSRCLLGRKGGHVQQYRAKGPAGAQGCGSPRRSDARLERSSQSSASGWASPMNYEDSAEIFAEMATLAPIFGGMSHHRLESGGIQWPCPSPDHPGTPFLHQGNFTRGRGLFHVIDYRPPQELPDAEYPGRLTTGRRYAHYHTLNHDGQVSSSPQGVSRGPSPRSTTWTLSASV